MTKAMLLILSGILIGSGLALVWRDMRKRRRAAFVSQRDMRAETESEVEITIAHRPRVAAEPGAADAGQGVPQAPPSESASGNGVDRRPQAALTASLEEQWQALQPALAAGVDKINDVLTPAGVRVGPSGEPTWSYKNRGYGAYRRVIMRGESVAWLRLELTGDGRLGASVKSHKDQLAAVNAVADAPVEGLSALVASDLLSECLGPAAKYAVGAPRPTDSERDAGERAWQSVNALVAAALKATNGALAQAGARLVPVAPAAWDTQMRRHRMTLSVEVFGSDVARMHIERLAHEIEVAVGVPDARMIDLGRRRRASIDGLTTHALAELIASCAWPAIARSRENRRSA
jgi:hypothetical protein